MDGDDRVRFCEQCHLNVYNISQMTSDEARELLNQRNASKWVCVRFYRRSDGTILTQDCPIGLKRLRANCGRLWQKVASAILCFFSLQSHARANSEAPQPQRAKPQPIEFLVTPQVSESAVPQPASGHTMGVPVLNFHPFMKDTQKRIIDQWKCPTRKRPSKAPRVTFKVDKEGRLSDLNLKSSSGSDSYDKSALKAVRKAAPFANLPVGMDETVDMEFTFEHPES